MQSKDLKKNNREIVFAATAGLIGRATALLAPFLILGLFIECLGDEISGIYSTAVSFGAMLGFCDFGLRNASLTRLSRLSAVQDTCTRRSVLGASYLSLTIIAFAISTLIGITTLIWSYKTGNGKVSQYWPLCFCVVGINTVSMFPLGLLSRLFLAKKKFFHAQCIQYLGPCLAAALTFVAVLQEVSPELLILIYATAPTVYVFMYTVIYFFIAKSDRPILNHRFSEEAVGLFHLGVRFLVLAATIAISMNVDSIIIGIFDGGQSVTHYIVPFRLGNILVLAISSLQLPIWSLFGNAIGSQDFRWLRITAIRASLIGGVLTFFLGCLIVINNQALINLWVGRSFENQGLVVCGSVAFALAVAATAPFNLVLNAAEKPEAQFVPWLVFLAVTTALKTSAVLCGQVWSLPWIAAFSYISIISPIIFMQARKIQHSNLEVRNVSTTAPKISRSVA